MPKLRVAPLTWIFVAFVALALIESQLQVLLPLERRLSDLFIRIQARHVEPDPDIVIVDIDDRSLERMAELVDRWPWPRSVHGELVAGIAAQKPKAILFDIFFAEPDRTRPESDELFNELVKPYSNVYFPTVRHDPSTDAYGVLLREMAKPLGMLVGRDVDPNARANLMLPLALWPDNWRLGVVNFLPESDGVARSYYLYITAYGWKIPSLPARVAADLGYKVPERESLLLGWSARTRKHVSYVDLYVEFNREKRQRDQAEFKDKIVIVGTAATGMYDLRVTPITDLHPGVEIIAAALENLKNGTWMTKAPTALPVVVTLGLMALVFVAFRQQRHTLTVGAVLAPACTALLAASYFAASQRLVLPLFTPIAFAVSLFFASALYQYLHERRERLKAVDYFTRFVNPHVVKDLLAHGGLSKAGESREITLLFSDIRGFTTLSETRSPQEIVALLNRYFGRQVEVIFRHGGCLDKFIGDAIMAFWGAPLDDPDHAKHAVMAALEMAEALESFKRELGELGANFDVGIGLDSGPAVVGLIGSDNKREYTAIGDTVNLASRIEGLTKGVARILVSEETMRRCAGDFDFADRGLYKVKGREKGRSSVRTEKENVMKHDTWLWLAAALLMAAATAAAETGYTLRAIDLKAKPFLDSDTVAKLPDKAELEIVVRQGPWMQVKTKDQKTGYVRLLQVRLGATVTAKDPGGYVPVPGTGAGTSSSRPTTTATVTTGVRGFSEEDLKASQPNKAEYEKMKGFAATPEQAAAYAASVKLAARTVPYYGEDGKALKDKGGKK